MAGFDPLRRVDAYRYELPERLIATAPAAVRDQSKLLEVGRDGACTHRAFSEFPELLRAGDVLVINETRVVRARLHATREPGGGAAEVLLLRPAGHAAYDTSARTWMALVRPGRRIRLGSRLRFGDDGFAEVTGVESGGIRELTLALNVPLETLLERHGELPLPPYVGPGDEARAARYQTVFARVPGSVAAPTASLHFTPETFERIRARGVTVAPLVLDVGFATFKPMSGETIDEHVMHPEHYAIPAQTAAAIEAAKREGRRVVAAGTTVLRALEGAVADGRGLVEGDAETRLFVTPGFRFEVVDALLTNFHLPASTLLVLVTAFGGYERVMNGYKMAIESGYRFFSFGDAMFLERAS